MREKKEVRGLRILWKESIWQAELGCASPLTGPGPHVHLMWASGAPLNQGSTATHRCCWRRRQLAEEKRWGGGGWSRKEGGQTDFTVNAFVVCARHTAWRTLHGTRVTSPSPSKMQTVPRTFRYRDSRSDEVVDLRARGLSV